RETLLEVGPDLAFGDERFDVAAAREHTHMPQHRLAVEMHRRTAAIGGDGQRQYDCPNRFQRRLAPPRSRCWMTSNTISSAARCATRCSASRSPIATTWWWAPRRSG